MQRQFRLRHQQDFERLRQKGRIYQNRWLLISVLPNELSHNRYGLITRKQLGKAVVRNRVRRLMREALGVCHPRLQPGWDVVLIARQALVGEPLTTIQRIVEELFEQADMLRVESLKP